MRKRFVPLFGLLAVVALAPAQRLTSVYNRDTGDQFELKKVESKTVAKGPVAKTTTVYTFHNPHKTLTEASFNFEQPWGAALDGFAYWYKNEYVPGMLMDKDQAWFIYTAITSRNRDPGIMEQVAPNSYHAQIYPLAVGYDLRIELQSLEFMNARPDRFIISAPSWPQVETEKKVEFNWTVDPMEGGLIKMIGNDYHGQVRELYAVDAPVDIESTSLDVRLLGQKWTDGATYVAGTVRTHKPTGMDRYGAGFDQSDFKIFGMDEVYAWPAEDSEYAFHFAGMMKTPRSILVRRNEESREVFLRNIGTGDWTSKLFAQAKLTYGKMYVKQEALDFSLKYQVPSSYTALLAVPKEEWKLFEEKKKEWQAEQRRIERERQRAAAMPPGSTGRPLNWDNSFGGDPEIRVQEKNAVRAEAVLPDGRVLILKRLADGWWTANFEIPATAPEGLYKVKIRFYTTNKLLREQVITYTVDRTAPLGKVEYKATKDGVAIIVRAEPGLHEITLQLADGRILKFAEGEPGVYKIQIKAKDARQKGAIVLKDDASNKSVIPCIWPALR